MSILVFMSETNTRQGTAMFIHNLVTNCIGYSNPFLTQKKPRNERKNTMNPTIRTAPSRPSPQSTPWPSCVSDRYLLFTRKLELPCAKRGAGMILDRSGRVTRALRPRRRARVTELVLRAHVLPASARIAVDRRAISARTSTSGGQETEETPR